MARALGLDFGTTNTVLAMADGANATHSMSFTSAAGTADSMRTALSFMKDPGLGAAALKVEAGHAAIRQFIDNPGDCRFLQSIKTFAASALFQGTLIFAKRHRFEDLMEIFVRRLRAYAGEGWPDDVSRIVAGRPVHFAGANPDPALANEIAQWRDGGKPAAVFMIGGPDGLAASLADKADLRLAFGAATWPHQLVRVMLLEQLYRATTILAGHPYHRA